MSADVAFGAGVRSDTESDRKIMRMAVGWQNPETRAISAVGLLEFDGKRHRFCYLRQAATVADFRPFISFPKLKKLYESDDLFPLFAQRAMSPRRPDYSEYLRSLDLDDTATTWEQIARTEGRLAGDTIFLVPEPTVDPDGTTVGCFLVAGIRHRMPDSKIRDRLLSELRPGDALLLRDEPSNPVNPQAILVSKSNGTDIGWVPNMLVEYVHHVRRNGDTRIQVRHANGPSSPIHMRLLVELRGSVEPHFRPFAGRGWEPYV